MIELENLNNQPIDEILDEARKQIMYLGSEWTNLQESDPGITLVELFVWLKWVQHEYLNRVSMGIKEKFLRLLDIEKYRNSGSFTLIQVSEIEDNLAIPQGTPFKAGNIVFHNLDRQELIKSRILSVLFENPDIVLEEEYYKFDGNRTFYLFGSSFKEIDKDKKRSFSIKFDNEVPSGIPFNLYFSVYLSKELKRNSVAYGDKFDEMAEISWEYYGVEKGILDWHQIEVINDETHRFLFSGIVKLKINGEMESSDGVYVIRATLVSEEYDFYPKIDNIMANVFTVQQKLTKCENLIFKKKDIRGDFVIAAKTHMSIYGNHFVYIKESDGWVPTKGFTFERDVQGGYMYLTVNSISEILNNYSDDDEVLMIVSYDKDIEKMMILGDGTGTSGQIIELREQNVLYEGIGIMVGREKEGRMVYSVWQRVDDFFSSDKYDEHYVFDEKSGNILFGDHCNGVAPRIGKGNIRLCKLEFCAGSNSNIREGMISAASSENEQIKNSRITQIIPASGGKENEPMEHAQARAADLFSSSGRAVTIQDYENIVRNTPGLIFKNVRILPNFGDKKDVESGNCVTVAVRWNNKVGLNLPDSYKRNIMRQIDKYRLINTKVNVVSPAYVGIMINGQIVVNSFYKQNENLIEKQIKRFISALNRKFGQTLHYGDLFGMIDRLDYVSYLEKLKIIPIGDYVQKTVSEDIIIPPNGVYYIERINLSYIRNSEIYRD